MAHHNANEDAAGDYAAAFAELPEVMQSALLGMVRAARALADEQVQAAKSGLDSLLVPGAFDGPTAEFLAGAATVAEAHYDELRARNP